jgi:hypothetical protein
MHRRRPCHARVLGARSQSAPVSTGLLILLFVTGCQEAGSRPAGSDPLAQARAAGTALYNPEAAIPPSCYARTDNGANPCWVCHTAGHRGPGGLADLDLQQEYSFSPAALRNAWSNLFVDRSAAIDGIADEELLAHVRGDNYAPLRAALTGRRDYRGWVPDLDLDGGVDPDGFARDGSGWRALRYQPFPGEFWPSNGGSAGELFVRLPRSFRQDRGGQPSAAVYRLNLSLVEAALAGLPRTVEPVDERLARFDLDGDGRLGLTTRITALPPSYAGAADDTAVTAGLYPAGVEFLHPVRYLDPDAPALGATRLKELRYARKVEFLDPWALQRAREREAEEKEEGFLPRHRGSPEVGLRNALGWQFQAFLEDAEGRLRLATAEEHRFCIGCHGGIGVAIDASFALPRKLPGAAGWRRQDLRGMQDRPQRGQRDPEILQYVRRARGADDFRANQELLERLTDAAGQPREELLRAAGAGGPGDLFALLAPSRERALALGKAYWLMVREQSFVRGRLPVLSPVTAAHRLLRPAANEEPPSTGLGEAGRIFADGTLQLQWDTP